MKYRVFKLPRWSPLVHPVHQDGLLQQSRPLDAVYLFVPKADAGCWGSNVQGSFSGPWRGSWKLETEEEKPHIFWLVLWNNFYFP